MSRLQEKVVEIHYSLISEKLLENMYTIERFHRAII